MTKTEKILSAYERFGIAIAGINDEHAQMLHKASDGARAFVSEVRAKNPKITTSQASAGLEQGLRETPQLILAVAPEWRTQVSKAFHDALMLEYPEFLALEAERLNKVLARGKIRSEAEYYLVRHEIDMVEGDLYRRDELKVLYALVDAFEART
jgi:hypothetical protein